MSSATKNLEKEGEIRSVSDDFPNIDEDVVGIKEIHDLKYQVKRWKCVSVVLFILLIIAIFWGSYVTFCSQHTVASETESTSLHNVTDSYQAPESGLTTVDLENKIPDEYWSATTYKIAEIHNFHPESIGTNEALLPSPDIGWTCWWSDYDVNGYDPVGVAFTNAIIDEYTMDIIHESPLSDLLYKPYSYNGKDGKFHGPMFQVRGSSDSLVNGHVAYLLNLNNKTEWKRIGIKLSKPATDQVKDDQTSFTVKYKKFSSNEGTIFTVSEKTDWKDPKSELTTLDISNVIQQQYWNGITYKISDIHNFHPESNEIDLPQPEIGWKCWWGSHGTDGYDGIGVAFTNAIINETSMEIKHESILSDLVYKSWSYKGKDGQFHEPMFQVRGTSNELVNGHVAYLLNMDDRKQWKRIGVKVSKPAADKVEDDQTSFIVRNKIFSENDGEIFNA